MVSSDDIIRIFFLDSRNFAVKFLRKIWQILAFFDSKDFFSNFLIQDNFTRRLLELAMVFLSVVMNFFLKFYDGIWHQISLESSYYLREKFSIKTKKFFLISIRKIINQYCLKFLFGKCYLKVFRIERKKIF